jgi:hypothetical protein
MNLLSQLVELGRFVFPPGFLSGQEKEESVRSLAPMTISMIGLLMCGCGDDVDRRVRAQLEREESQVQPCRANGSTPWKLSHVTVASHAPGNSSEPPTKSFFVASQLHNDSDVSHSPDLTAYFMVENGDVLRIDAQWSEPLSPEMEKRLGKDSPHILAKRIPPGQGLYVYLDTNGYTSLLLKGSNGVQTVDSTRPRMIIVIGYGTEASCSSTDLPPLAAVKPEPTALEMRLIDGYPALGGRWREMDLSTEAVSHTEDGGLKSFVSFPCCELTLYKYFKRPVPLR